jgi:hypothetical protein
MKNFRKILLAILAILVSITIFDISFAAVDFTGV